MKLQQRIDQAGLLREQGNISGALMFLTDVIKQAEALQDYQSLASALGHRIICHKHLFQNGGGRTNISAMEIDIERGLRLPIPDVDKAVFCLRSGDAQMLRQNFPADEAAYTKACGLVQKSTH